MDKKFNELLKSARLKAGLTQAQLAEKIGVPKSTYCNWEQGTREPNVLKLKQIARALGVTMDSLVGLEESDALHELQSRFGAERLRAYAEAIEKLTGETTDD